VFSAVDPLISLLVEFIFIGRRCCAKYAIVSYMLRMWIKRDVEARLKRSAKMRPVIVLTGARQTGKTSTFRHLFPDYAFVSLDLPTEAEQAEKEPQRFLQRNPPPVAPIFMGGSQSPLSRCPRDH
jgi:hypothetical protein